MKTNIFSVPMMYGIIKKMLPDDDFSFEVVSKSNDSISFKLYIFRPADEQTGEFITDLIMADTFIQLLAKIEAL